MIRHILFLALCLSHLAHAEIIDTDKQRTFFTTKNPCKLSIPKSDFVIAKEQIKPDGTTVYYHLTNDKYLVNLSFYLDTLAVECNNGKACLDAALKNPAYEKAQNIKKYERSGFQVGEASLDFPLEHRVVKQLNLVAEKYRNGCWADIHLSQVGETLPDVEKLLILLDKISVE